MEAGREKKAPRNGICKSKISNKDVRKNIQTCRRMEAGREVTKIY